MITKICNQCKRELPVTEFYKNWSSKLGVSSKCKDCDNIRLNNNKRAQKYLKRIADGAEKGDIVTRKKVTRSRKTSNLDDDVVSVKSNQVIPTHKVCKGCGKELPFGDFYKSKNCKYGIATHCKKCCSNIAKDDYKKRKIEGYYSMNWEERQVEQHGIVPIIPHVKICRKCHRECPLTEFGKNKMGEFGLSDRCKECERARNKEYYKTDKCQDRLRDWAERQKDRRKSQQYKLCTGCNLELPLDQFFNKTNGKFGVEVLCKKCKHKKNGKYRHSDKGRASGKRSWNKRRKSISIVVSTLTDTEWEEIKKRYDYRCVYCGKKKPLTQDHIIPVSKNGHHVKGNIVPACQSCNSIKGTKPVLLQLLALAS